MNTVSVASIIGMIVSLCVAFGLPIAAALLAKKRLGGRFAAVGIGAMTFVLAALVLEQLFHVGVRFLAPWIFDNVWLLALYGGLAAALFEEAGRYLTMKHLMKKSLTPANAVLYGIGHGGAEAIATLGLMSISNLMNTFLINTGMLASTLSTVDEATRATALEQLSALWTTAPMDFYLAGAERIAAFALQLALSYFVFRALRTGKKSWLLLAFGLHFAVDAGTVALARGLNLPTLAVEAIVLVVCIAIAAFAWRLLRQDRQNASS